MHGKGKRKNCKIIKSKPMKSNGQTDNDKYRVAAHEILQNIISE